MDPPSFNISFATPQHSPQSFNVVSTRSPEINCQHLASSQPEQPAELYPPTSPILPSRPIQLDHHHHHHPLIPSFTCPHAAAESERDWIKTDGRNGQTSVDSALLLLHPASPHSAVDDHRSIIAHDDQGGDGFNGIDCFVCLTLSAIYALKHENFTLHT